MSLESIEKNKVLWTGVTTAAVVVAFFAMTGEAHADGAQETSGTEPGAEFCVDTEAITVTVGNGCPDGFVTMIKDIQARIGAENLPRALQGTPEEVAHRFGGLKIPDPGAESLVVHQGATLTYNDGVLTFNNGGGSQTLLTCNGDVTKAQGIFFDSKTCPVQCPPQAVVQDLRPVAPEIPTQKIQTTPFWRQEDVPSACPEGLCGENINVFGQRIDIDPADFPIVQKMTEIMQGNEVKNPNLVVEINFEGDKTELVTSRIDSMRELRTELSDSASYLFNQVEVQAKNYVALIQKTPELAAQFNALPEAERFVVMEVKIGPGPDDYVSFCYNPKENTLSLFDPGTPGGKTANAVSVTDSTFWETRTIKLSDDTLVRVNDPVTPLVVGEDGTLRAVETGQNNKPTAPCPPTQKNN